MLLSSSISLMHNSPTPALQGSYTPTDLGMHLTHASALTSLSPLSSHSPELLYEHSLVASFANHALAEYFPIEALRDTCIWRQFRHG